MNDYELCFHTLSIVLDDRRSTTTWPRADDLGALTGIVPAPLDQRLMTYDLAADREVPESDYESVGGIYVDEWLEQLIAESTVYWIEPDLCTVIDHAAHYLPPTHQLAIEQVPARLGFVTLGEATFLPIDADKHNRCDAIFWHRTPDGVVLDLIDARYTDERDPVPQPYHRLVTQRWGHVNHDPWASWITAFWLFIVQRIPHLEQQRASRATRRHVLPDRPLLHQATIATLRRREARPDEARPTDVEWSHRWLVSGHWREQYYPSTDEHKTIWIAPYVKGPDALPLVHKDRAFMVVR